MRYKFCSIRINITKYDVTFATKGGVLTLDYRSERTNLTLLVFNILILFQNF